MKENENLKSYAISEINQAHIYGRTGSRKMPLPLFFTGSGVELRVSGTELWVTLETDYETFEPWISIEINGAWIGRQMVTTGKQDICIFRNMDAATVKRVRIFRDLQPMAGDGRLYLQLHGIKSDGEFFEVPEKSRKIEFIGDSITSGEGSIGAREEMDWIPMWFTALNNYAVMTADKVNADFRIISQCGWGVLTGWDNNPECALPDYYEQVCGLCHGEENDKAGAKEEYDFASWQPDFVVVNLGTNDDGAFNSPEWVDPKTGEMFKQRKNEDGTYNEEDAGKVKEKAKKFLCTIRRRNPNAKILWAYGMLGTPLLDVLRQTVKEYCEENKDDNIELIVLPEATGDGIGARSHPGVINHRQAAEVLAAKMMEKQQNE